MGQRQSSALTTPPERITFTFTDRETKIPEDDFPVEQCSKADQLLAAIRKEVGF
jgi:hypothetical protein